MLLQWVISLFLIKWRIIEAVNIFFFIIQRVKARAIP